MQRLDAHTINKAFAHFNRQLELILPGVYEQQYASLWAEEGMYLPPATPLEMGVTSIVERIYEGVGEGVEISDLSDDIPMVSVTQQETSFNVHHFALSYGYTIMQLAREAKAGTSLNPRQIEKVDRGLRQMVHNQLLFGVAAAGKRNARGSKGLYNNPLVPISATTYNPNTATWQQHIDFIMARVTEVEIRNQLASGVRRILTDKRHLLKLSTTYQSGDSGKSVMTALTEILKMSNPNFEGIYAVNESSHDVLLSFGVNTVPANRTTRMILMPDDQNVISYGRIAPDYLEPERRGVSFKVAAISGCSELIIHAPNELGYVDFPEALI
jgi:hypothetical protein